MNMPRHLPRLDAAVYRGHCWAHWTMSMWDRGRGWLNDEMHCLVRELLIHTLSRYSLHCPGYCLMPDHGHFLWMGIREDSDQLRAARFFRRHWNAALSRYDVRLQPQAYDRVLRKSERRRDTFEDTVLYIFHNPARAGLVGEWSDWPFLGAMIPGFPDLPAHPPIEFWPRFWKIHNRECSRHET